jgi:hypothetical protein
MIAGQANLAKWKGEHPIYRSEACHIERYKCAPGQYVLGPSLTALLSSKSTPAKINGTCADRQGQTKGVEIDLVMSANVQVFGRRPPHRVDSLVMPASENLHSNGHGRLFDHLVGAGEK